MQSLWQFCLDHLSWVLICALVLGWVVHVLALKHLLVPVLRTIWGWTRFLSWVAWMILGYLAHLFLAAIKKLLMAAWNAAKRLADKAGVAFAHHKVVGVGVIIVMLWVLHTYLPTYPEWGHVQYMFQMVFTSYVVIVALVYLFKVVMRKTRS